MLKLKIVSLLLFFWVADFYAQESIIKKIREISNNYNQLISNSKAEGLDFHPPHFDIKTVQNRPALDQ